MMKKINDFVMSKKGFIVTTCGLFLLIFLINYFTIWAADDYAFYNNVWTGQDNFSIARIFESSNEFYFRWTGRYLSTVINYFFLYFPKIIFDFVNSFVFMGIVFVIYDIVRVDEKYNSYLLSCVFFMLWLFVPAIGQVMFWQIGSVIYSWMFFLVILLIRLYTKLAKNDSKVKDNKINMILLFILGIAAGNGFETNSIVLLCFIFLTFLYCIFIKKYKMPKWSYSGFIGSIIGSCTNFFSPGNSVRMSSMGTTGSLYDKIFYGAGCWFYNGFIRSKVFILLILLVFVYMIYALSVKKGINRNIFVNIFIAFIFIGFFCFTIGYCLSDDLLVFFELFYPNANKFLTVLVV